MWIFWGTQTQREVLGIAADLCANCNALQTFMITDHYKSDHIQFIRTSAWGYVATTKKCASCGTERVCNKRSYGALISLAEQSLPIEEILKRTNPRIAAKLNDEARKELLGNSSAPAKPESPAERAKSKEELKDLRKVFEGVEDNDAETYKLKEKLNLWDKLNAGQRRELAELVQAYQSKRVRLADTKDFLISMSLQFPGGMGKAGLVAALVLFAAWVGCIYFVPEELRWYFAIGGLPIMLCILLSMALLLDYCVAEAWYRTTLIPRAFAEHISADLLIAVAKDPSLWNIEEWNAAGRILDHRETLATLLEMEIEKNAGTS